LHLQFINFKSQTMKKLLMALILFIACKKENKERVTVTVLETGTTIAVRAARVILMRSNYGSSIPTTVFNGLTDQNGMVHIDADKYKLGTFYIIEKDKYFESTANKKTRLYITPIGWIKLQIHPVRKYPPTVYLNLEVRSQNESLGALGSMNLTADTDSTVLLLAFGGIQNKIVWNVFGVTSELDTNSTVDNLPVPRFDTLLNYSLEY
jgi:hypothetical protein